MRYLIILILLVISCTPPKPEQILVSGVSECNGPYGYNCGDFILLEQFIASNAQIYRHYLDIDSSGIIDPLEFGYQVWNDGRLVQLNLNYNEGVIMKIDNPIELDSINYRLTAIPDNIGVLDSLESLFLHDNEFSYVPESIGDLTKLKILDLENNFFTYLPDAIGNLINLEYLVLDNNQITHLPETIGNLSSLEKLEIRSNNLESLPESMGNLNSLEWLMINDNSLQSLHESIGNLGNLKILDVSNNELSIIPDTLCNIYPGEWTCEKNYEGKCIDPPLCMTPPKCLQTFSTNENFICGAIPACLERVSYQTCPGQCRPHEFLIEGTCADTIDYYILQNFLDLNHMAHYILDSEGNFTFSSNNSGNLDTLYTLFPDSAKEVVNDDWWDDGRLIEIRFDAKELYSEIPANFGNLNMLEILRLENNDLKGEIPDNLTNLTNLKVLKLNSNNLSGAIPQNIGSLSSIDTLWLNDNNLSGGIPQNITTLSKLSHLRLDYNDLSGSIPYNIGDLDSLRYLYLRNNDLSGAIPQSIGGLISLKILKLQNNKLSGKIPDSICNLYDNNEDFLNNNNLEYNKLCPGSSGNYPVCFTLDSNENGILDDNEDYVGNQDCEME